MSIFAPTTRAGRAFLMGRWYYLRGVRMIAGVSGTAGAVETTGDGDGADGTAASGLGDAMGVEDGTVVPIRGVSPLSSTIAADAAARALAAAPVFPAASWRAASSVRERTSSSRYATRSSLERWSRLPARSRPTRVSQSGLSALAPSAAPPRLAKRRNTARIGARRRRSIAGAGR